MVINFQVFSCRLLSKNANHYVSEIVINFSTFWQMEKEGLLQEFDKERLKLEVELDFELDFLHR